jgi:hypothetical protein
MAFAWEMPECIYQPHTSAPQLTYTQLCANCAMTCQILYSLCSLRSSQKKAQCFEQHITQSFCRPPYLDLTMQDRVITMLSQVGIITKCVTESRKELTRGLEARNRWDDIMTYKHVKQSRYRPGVVQRVPGS